MKYGTTIVTGIICGVALSGLARSINDEVSAPQSTDVNGDHYGSIWLRNVFDLKPAPEPVKPVEKPADPTPPPNVKLTGITTIFGKKMALFLVQPQPERGKPPGKEISYMIHENERFGDLEVLEIMPKERKVTIKVDDVVSTITFPTNAPSSGGPPGAHPPGGGPPPGLTAPNFTPPAFPRQMRPPGGGFTPQANNYSPNNYSPPSYSSGNQAAQGGVLQGGYVAPTGTAGAVGSGLSSAFTTPVNNLTANNVEPILNAEQQQAAIAITHQALMQSGTPESIGLASILPPVPGVTDGNNNNSSSGQNQNPTTPQQQQTAFGTRVNGQTVK